MPTWKFRQGSVGVVPNDANFPHSDLSEPLQVCQVARPREAVVVTDASSVVKGDYAADDGSAGV